MKQYRSISLNGQKLPITSLSYLRTLIRKNKMKEGSYTCITPSGTTHTITFATAVYSAKGYGKKPSGKSKSKGPRAGRSVYNVIQKSITVS